MKLKKITKNITKFLGMSTCLLMSVKLLFNEIASLMEAMTKILLEMTKFVMAAKEFLNLF
ncbi:MULTISPECIES: hypothetical protein [Bacillus cereus group]|uniref:hypothetical protein n=1 Tax=Bacillus cereus group TaxID=86661 RepID=UPI0007FB2022|nr:MULTISPECIES: hypothetical protein [Bacillus cereus group]OBW56037.1 hypothetical protein A9987_25175 [Bacillus cereus]PEM23061.1 hypothetical protein CN617_29430 [Bacillus wiedmannii]PGW22603.1 hypothetical protein COD95_13175 [Bacillus thuringiensis]